MIVVLVSVLIPTDGVCFGCIEAPFLLLLMLIINILIIITIMIIAGDHMFVL
jgi:hypothetical protein